MGGSNRDRGRAHTRRKGLLKLLGLVVVLQHQGVEVLLASDLELDVVGLLVLLDPRGCKKSKLVIEFLSFPSCRFILEYRFYSSSSGAAFQLAASKIRTRSVLATADLDELEKKGCQYIDDRKAINSFSIKILTFLISATSLGILAVFDRLCETGFVGNRE